MKISFITILIIGCSWFAQAQGGANDPTFQTGTGTDDRVLSIAVQDDNKILVGGWFNSYNGVQAGGIARLNVDGSADMTFITGSGIHGTLAHIALQPDGKILIAGQFDSYNNIPQMNIARLNPDGTIDPTFTGLCDYGSIQDVVIQSDGKIVIAGWFSSYNGTMANRIARLHPDGSQDNTFTYGSGTDQSIYTISEQADGKMLLGGGFSSYNGNPVSGLVRINQDGTFDPTFSPDLAIGSVISAITVLTDGKLMIGGTFSPVSGSTSYNILQLLNDGAPDGSFNAGTGIDGAVQSIIELTDGRRVIAGDVHLYNGSYSNNIFCLNADGSINQPFEAGNGTNSNILTLARQNDDKILIGGGFDTYNDAVRSGIARMTICGKVETEYLIACDSLEWHGTTYYSNTTDAADFHVFSDAATDGCDSIVILNLQIVPSETDVVLNADGSLTAQMSSGASSYQWINCATNTAITGATTQTFLPDENGNYAVVCGNGLCEDTSECIQVVNLGLPNDPKEQLFISPNPTNDQVHISFSGSDVELIVYDLQGKIVLKDNIHNQGTVSLQNFERGVYLFDFKNAQGHSVQRVVKQ